MKNLFIAMALALMCAMPCTAQIVQNAQGNYVTVAKVKPVDTGKTFTDKWGQVYPVYRSARGSLFVIRTSRKTGRQYKQYLKVEGGKP